MSYQPEYVRRLKMMPASQAATRYDALSEDVDRDIVQREHKQHLALVRRQVMLDCVAELAEDRHERVVGTLLCELLLINRRERATRPAYRAPRKRAARTSSTRSSSIATSRTRPADDSRASHSLESRSIGLGYPSWPVKCTETDAHDS
jgi:hypothetical protein